MRLFWVLMALLVAAEGVSVVEVVQDEWSLFKLQHNKTYTTDTEEQFRFKIFMDNKNKITEHNIRFAKGQVSFYLEMNHFGDMLHHEIVSTMNGFRIPEAVNSPAGVCWTQGSSYVEPAHIQLPVSVDWRTEGAVTPIKDQGPCGSCWAFSATGAVEGQHFRKTGKLISLSEQNLIDCSGKYGNKGCDGGNMINAFRYIKDNQGIDTERSYPYEGKVGQCRYNPSTSGATDSGYVPLPPGSEEKLMSAVGTVGPISVAIDASHSSFHFYSGGVYYESGCSATKLNHAVLVVGYSTQGGYDYWLVKNSWGESWGTQGYIKMVRNRNNNCGIATYASYPLV